MTRRKVTLERLTARRVVRARTVRRLIRRSGGQILDARTLALREAMRP